ncbi:MAG TPA: nucleoside-diphosphate kinase [Candidatus Saccharimonadales bacterium]|jgi:nucleoside-diphosphate kinase|nr:nucleoside-diphosphate kinase [Candidatus Saccharimonadales bacterium]
MERTFVILKPDALQRAISGEIVSRFERVGLKIIALKMVHPDKDHYYHHYENIGKMVSRRGQSAFDVTLDFMQIGPVIVMVLEGVEAISLVRKMVGTTEPKSALPGTVRGDYAHISFDYANSEGVTIPNLVHASGDKADADKEIAHWFSKDEIFDYDTVHSKYTIVNMTNKK